MILPALFTTGLALFVASALAFVLFRGRMSAPLRHRADRIVSVLALAVFVTLYSWGFVSRILDGEWLWVAAQPLLWIAVSVTVVRERRRRAKAKSRKPGTFDAWT